MKKIFIFVLIYLFAGGSVLAEQTQILPIVGAWKIIGYQIVGYPTMNEAKTKSWIGKVIEFTKQKTVTLYFDKTSQVCPKFTYQVTTENAKGYFLIGYEVKPHRFGITEEEIQLINVICKVKSWLGEHREFIKVSDEQILSYWDGVVFFFVKQSGNIIPLNKKGRAETLLITPQNVGMLNPASDFEKEILVEALPNYRVEKQTSMQTIKDSKRMMEHFEIYQQNKLILKVYPNPTTRKIASIRIFDNRALAPGNVKLGASYTDVFKNEEQLIDCQAGIEERGGQTLCSFKNMSSIQYVFKPKSNRGRAISPIEALNQAKLVEFVWKADTSLITETIETE
ncbi:DUF1131 family protein [Candidatus Parabeggiatoa sp. HSG14]|uniref:DUF1131 family protein n=1 Tax=Candidatus Parabeggiatoa sp. HSG14 TaxID=3055593 RepID=UPI0025A72D4F|nr:DUF1131 family protein [Thiotrichales bacterium HSG14]